MKYIIQILCVTLLILVFSSCTPTKENPKKGKVTPKKEIPEKKLPKKKTTQIAFLR